MDSDQTLGDINKTEDAMMDRGKEEKGEKKEKRKGEKDENG